MDSRDTEALLAEYAVTRDRALRDRIVEAHLYIAQIIARKFSGRGVDYDDLYQVAAFALTKAVDRFDPAHGVRFASFVTPGMVGEVKNYFRDKSRTIRTPRRSAEAMGTVRGSVEKLTQTLGRSPRVEEIAADTGLGEELIIETLDAGAMNLVSLDAQLAEDEDFTLEKSLGIEEAGYGEFELRDLLRRGMEGLPGEQRQLLRLRFFENRSQRETAAAMGVSQMTISRMERRALESLRKYIGNGDI